jgi:uncharacterized protein (DUF2126 family)
MRTDAAVVAPDATDPRLRRNSVDARPTPASGLRDELAEAGAYLFVLHLHELDGVPTARLELPLIAEVPTFLAVLETVAQASLASHLPTLVLAGYPPPVDATVEWTTVTPDPAVIEINSAPSQDAADFLRRSSEIHAAAVAQGLAPYRLYFNGTVADSGGAGQITLGGPSPTGQPLPARAPPAAPPGRLPQPSPGAVVSLFARLRRQQRPVGTRRRARHGRGRRTGSDAGPART